MAESFVAVTAGAGTKLHTFQRVIGANTVEQDVVLHGEPYLATYQAFIAATSIATANSHLFQIMAGGSLPLYIRRIRIYQVALATTAAISTWQLWRLSTAGTGGTATTPTPLYTTDAASGGTCMTLPTVKGNEATQFDTGTFQVIQTVGTGGAGFYSLLLDLDWDNALRSEVPRIAAGAANGIAFKQVTAIAAGTVVAVIKFSEASF